MFWLEFAISAGVIIAAGIWLTMLADQISQQMNLGRVWVGVVMLGLVTSLPETITSVYSTKTLGATDLAIGNIVGSNMFNPLLIVIMDFMSRKGSVTNQIGYSVSNSVAAIYAMLMAFVLAAGILIQSKISVPHIGSISLSALIIAFLYIWGMRWVAMASVNQTAVDDNDVNQKKRNIPMLWLKFIVCAVIVVFGSMRLAKSADMIALQSGLGRTFVGSTLLAMVTSLPEIVVSVSAMNIGAIDLAIGNIFGSNMTNIFIVFLCEWVYQGKLLLSTVSINHAVTAVIGSLMVGVILIGSSFRQKRTFAHLGWDSIIILMLFISGTAFLYCTRS